MSTLDAARRFDLHIHSSLSDGAYGPEDVLARCAAAGLDVVALTDHDICSGLSPGPMEFDGRVLHVIAGAEISGVHEGREYHLLVYFEDQVPEAFAEFCTRRARARAHRYERAVSKIGLPGLPAADEDALRGDVSLTRHHLARALVDAGHAATLNEAFQRYANRTHVPCVDLSFCDAIQMARRAGGVTSWAHPPVQALRQHLGTFVAAGLQGLEAYRPYLSGRDRKLIRKLAKRHGLFVTGGSDWHGWNDGAAGLFSVSRQEIGGFLEALC